MEECARHCSLCKREVNKDEAPILAMGGFGNPRYLCDECSHDVDGAMGAKEPDAIEAAMKRISEKLSAVNTDDSLVIETVSSIFEQAGSRARQISEGTYDFSLDEKQENEENTDVPEELRESEEDKQLDEEDKKKSDKFDKVFNIIALVTFAVTLAVFAIIYFT